ncbi:carbohydrate-responsive element-binding protein isoform X1 [Metopolophium dirhodum]|uniref:carbohydrate-responsive element-binding protein isoform X1 n=3 Tax=Metopolophium dirhodum TaxID=44670 RepID=UPI002990048D|nr:carbohydrate-responsive element-binding protein isoform X1 [Metopolophium dirhodum]
MLPQTTNAIKETIHSGHFMVSSFEAEAQDDEYQVAVPVSEEILTRADINNSKTSLNNLFQCMSVAYRHKLTSPKWNRFKGVRLRWKDKIRLNNLIWRCWHMQFIKKSNYMICQFASPVEIVDIHKQPEAVVLEGKYWKRKFNAVTAEYKKWRLFYRSLLQNGFKERQKLLNEFLEWQQNNCDIRIDDDYMNFISDTLFSTVTSNSRIFEFPNAREDKSTTTNIADFIQPSLGQLQPNLDEFMDTIEPLQDLFSPPKLPPVPEECHMSTESSNNLYSQPYGNVNTCYQTNQHSLSLHSELNQLKMTNMRQETTDSSCPLHANSYSTGENYQSNFPTMFHQSSNGSYQSNNLSYNNIPTGAAQPHHNEMQIPPPPPVYSFEFNNSNISHEPVLNSNSYNQHQDISATNTSVMNYGNGSSTNDFKNRTPQVQTYNKFPPIVRNTQDHFVAPKIRQRQRGRQSQPKQKVMQSSINPSNDNNQSVLLAQLLSSNNMFSTPSSTVVSTNMAKFRNTNGSYQTYQQVPQVPQVPQIPYQLIQRRARTPDHVLTSYTDHLVYRKPSPVFMNQSDCNVYNLTPNTRGLIDAVGTPGGIHQLPQIQPRFDIPHGNTQGYSTYRLPQPQEYVNHSVSVMDKPSPTSNQPSPTNNYSQPLNTPIPQSVTSPMACSTDLCQKTHSPNQSNESVNLSQRNGSMSMPTHVMIPGPSRTPYKEHRRVCHINAEQKRRCNIKNGFDMLNMLIPQINQNPNTKMSKAAMLQKGADYILQLRSERARLYEERQNLQQQVESLNLAISNCQAMLPATGAPFSRQRTTKMKEMFDEYVKKRTQENWKFYILSLIAEPLLNSFNSSVSTSSYDEMYRTTLQWVEQHCTLGDLRPIALNALRNLCTSTEILSDPSNLPEEINNIIQKSQTKHQSQGNRN